MRHSVKAAVLLQHCGGHGTAAVSVAAAPPAAAAGLSTSAAVAGAAVAVSMQQARPALLGAVFPGRTLLIKKLRKAVGPSPAQLEQQRQQRLAQRSQEQLARAELRSARREASRRWLAEVVAAAQGQRVGELVAALSRHDQLWQAKAASVGRGGGGGAGARAAPHSDRPGLPGHAALLAARHLADPRRGGSARHAQAFVELLIERGQLAPRRARSAVHAVLQAYDREGDLSKARFDFL